MPQPFKKEFLCLLLSLLFCSERKELSLKIYFLDVGHGDCIFLQTPDDGIRGNGEYEGLCILIDGGEERMGREILLPFLRQNRIDTIDCLIATHFHSDHIGGLIPVLESFPVRMILTNTKEKKGELNGRFLELAAQEGCSWRIVQAGETIFWGKEMEVFILNPEKLGKEENNNSIVLKIEYEGKKILLTGDIEGKERKEDSKNCRFVERSLVDKNKEILRSHILKVAHHGSETSSTEEFLAAVRSEVAVITAGRKKFGGHILPDSSVVLRLRKFGAQIYRTDFGDTDYQTAPGDDHILIKISSGKIDVRYLHKFLIF